MAGAHEDTVFARISLLEDTVFARISHSVSLGEAAALVALMLQKVYNASYTFCSVLKNSPLASFLFYFVLLFVFLFLIHHNFIGRNAEPLYTVYFRKT
ncbi:MAG TPA: hypothetical protein DEF89_01150 [Desulfosporosinus sp.]|nr:hypothetical protein [Desulfosporosinus sp.]